MRASAEDLGAVLGDEVVDSANVPVIAPATTQSRLRFWFGDLDKATARAELIQSESVKGLRSHGVQAQGHTGESDPLLAAQDAVATFDPARVVVFAHQPEDERYREADLTDHLTTQLSIPGLPPLRWTV